MTVSIFITAVVIVLLCVVFLLFYEQSDNYTPAIIPRFDVIEGEHWKNYQGRSRRGCVSYWKYSKEVIINDITKIITAPDEHWLKRNITSYIEEQRKITFAGVSHDSLYQQVVMVCVVSMFVAMFSLIWMVV